MGNTHLHVGGLVAAGFDASGTYLLTVSHSGCGVFDSRTWQRVARDDSDGSFIAGQCAGIGPVDGQLIPLSDVDFETGTLTLRDPLDRWSLSYEEGMIAVAPAGGRVASRHSVAAVACPPYIPPP